jgi:hypothetical protein
MTTLVEFAQANDAGVWFEEDLDAEIAETEEEETKN